MGFGIATQTGVSAAIQSIPSMMANKGLRNGYGATFAENFTDGTNTLDPRITFSRASNATVTGSNGLIQYAPHNLLTYSEQFDNAYWTKDGATITSNSITAPNGTTTADKLVENTATSQHRVYATQGSATPTVSVYVKYSGRQWIRIEFASGSANAWFDVQNGVVGSTTGSVTSTIQSVGDGWYRITATRATTTSFTVFALASADGSEATYTGDGTSGIYIWGAQLNVGSLQDYNPTTVKNLLGYSEAFDNAAWTKSNSFVQTNLLLQSEAFDSASWVKQSGCTVTANSGVSPNGTTTADLVTTTSGDIGSYQIVTGATSTTYTASIYAKAGTANILKFGLTNQNESATQYYAFNLTTQEITLLSNLLFTNYSSSITSVGNGWYRCSVTATSPASGVTGIGLFPRLTVAGNLQLWGAQLVQGSVAGDYQQTTSAALPVQYQAPNGTMTADKLVENTATAEHRVQVTPTLGSAPITASVYFKAAERSWSFIRLDDAVSSKYAYFNLATGVVGTVTAGLTASITSVGNGWYRCSALFSAPTAGSGAVIFAPTTGNSTSSYAGDGTSGIYIWGAQLSDSASLDTYVNNPVAAPTAAAYYGARFDYSVDSTITPSITNLLTYSQEFDNAAWQKVGSTVTANSTTAPNGSTTADTLVEDSSTGRHDVQITSGISLVSGVAYTASVYAKASSRNFIQITFSFASHGTGQYANFNLATGAVGNTTGGTAAITAAGDGWYRCSFTATATGTGSASQIIGLINADTASRLPSYTGNGTSGAFLWGAQLETGSTVETYVPTTSAPASIPPVLSTSPKGLLIEEQRTNLLTYSEQFDNASWSSLGTVTIAAIANQAIAPNGSTTADSLSDGTATGTRAIGTTASITLGTTYTLSCYVKANTTSNIQLSGSSGAFGTNIWATFDLATSAIGASGSSVTASSITAVGNGWYRCTVSGVATATTSSTAFVVVMVDSPTATRLPSYTGTNANSVFLWGAQLEAGAFATSYIPTTTAQVTRSADVALVQGSNFSSWYNVNEGTVFAQGDGVQTTNSSLVAIRDSAVGYNNQITLDRTSSSSPRFSVRASNVDQAVFAGGVVFTANTVVKLAGAYMVNNFGASFNGSSIASDTSGSVPISIAQMEIGRLGSSQGEYINGHIRQIAYYPRRLQNSELQAITS